MTEELEVDEVLEIEEVLELFYINTELNLPNHSNELCKAEEVTEKIKRRFDIMQEELSINDKSHENMYEELIRVLDYVGRLSMFVFEIEDLLEELYTRTYLSEPEKAKKSWMRHYEGLHRPYNLLKNRLFRMLDELDSEYIRIHKCDPPNMKI